jgi:hypothetical protein
MKNIKNYLSNKKNDIILIISSILIILGIIITIQGSNIGIIMAGIGAHHYIKNMIKILRS